MDKATSLIKGRIVALMDNRRISQAQLSRMTNLRSCEISRICTGKRKASIKQLTAISKALNVPLEYLITGEDRKPGWVDPDIQSFFEHEYNHLPYEVKTWCRSTVDLLRSFLSGNFCNSCYKTKPELAEEKLPQPNE